MQNRIRIYELDPSTGLATRPRSKNYKVNDSAIKTLVTQFDNNNNVDNDAIFCQLLAIQFRLSKNGLDQLDE